MTSLEKRLFKSFSHVLIVVCFSGTELYELFVFRMFVFLYSVFVFLALSCMNSLYILEINPFSVVSFAIIFSHSEGCLLTLLIVSFAAQKFLNLIRSYLFAFFFFFPSKVNYEQGEKTTLRMGENNSK